MAPLTGLVLAAVLAAAPGSSEEGLPGLDKALIEARELVVAGGSPIRFDKAAYSCSDQVRVTLAAPGWNSSPYRIDSIGGDSENPIKISTREDRLSPYRLSETGPDTGIFAGQFLLRCSGRAAAGSGRGPNDGVLGAGPDDVLTVSFNYAEGRFIRASAPLGGGGSAVSFDKSSYADQETGQVRVRDADMNLNPEAPDRVDIIVYSDSDLAGTVLSGIETGDATGEFAGSVFFSGNRPSSGERLHVAPGNTVYAVYVDRTLPPPNRRGDSRRLTATAVIR
jgi:hypothetical protein